MKTCSVPGCSGSVRAKGYCGKHYARVVRNGDPTIRRPGGRRPGYGKRQPGDSRYFDKHSGYVNVYDPTHPHATPSTGLVKEHVWVMTKKLGRALRPGESVHHKNGDRTDNRIENLELWDCKQPPGQRVEDKIAHYIAFLQDHGYTITK